MGDDSRINNMVEIGPAGIELARNWDEKERTNLVQIFVSHGDEINSIQFQYADDKGKLVLSQRHGNNVGNKFDVVKLNYPTEYITWISGRQKSPDNRICSIIFGTNFGQYGPFGSASSSGSNTNYGYHGYGSVSSADKEFSFRLGEDRQFGGFYGTADISAVKSIGVYLKPITTLDDSRHKNTVELTEE